MVASAFDAEKPFTCACGRVSGFSLQLLQVFQKHKELIRRPTVSRELQPERETLLARLLDYNKGAQFRLKAP